MVTATYSAQQIREALITTLPMVGVVMSEEFRNVIVPHPKEKLVMGGIQGGKSTELAAEFFVAISALATEINMGHRESRNYLYWITMPSYMTPTKEMHYLNQWFSPLGVITKWNNPQGAPSRLELYEGMVVIETRTAQDMEGIASESVDGFGAAEAGQMPGEIRERALERTITRNGWVVYSGTMEDDAAKPRYAWYGELGRKWLEHPTSEGRAFSLPTWANLAVHPLGRNSPAIIAEERRWLEAGKVYMFNRRMGGIPDGNPDPVYIDVQAGHWGAGDVKDWTWIRTHNAGGHDWGDTPGHPSTLAAITVSDNNIAVVRDVWEAEGVPVEEVEMRRHLMGQRWNIPKSRWSFDPMLQRAAKLLGVSSAATGKGARKRRVAYVENRLKMRRLLFDIDIQDTDSKDDMERKYRVQRCFQQFQRVHWITRESPGEGFILDYARVDDDMAAAVEDAIEFIDTKKKLATKGWKSYSTVR